MPPAFARRPSGSWINRARPLISRRAMPSTHGSRDGSHAAEMRAMRRRCGRGCEYRTPPRSQTCPPKNSLHWFQACRMSVMTLDEGPDGVLLGEARAGSQPLMLLGIVNAMPLGVEGALTLAHRVMAAIRGA